MFFANCIQYTKKPWIYPGKTCVKHAQVMWPFDFYREQQVQHTEEPPKSIDSVNKPDVNPLALRTILKKGLCFHPAKILRYSK